METSSSQLVLWMEYLDWEANAFDKTCHYLAQIAAEVRRSYVRSGTRVKIEDFIMKFTVRRRKDVPEDVQMKANKFKQFFFTLTGLTGKKKKGKR